MLYSFSPAFDIHSLPSHCLTLLLFCSFLCLFWNPFDRYMVKSYLSVDLFQHVLTCSSLNSPHSCLHCPWPWPLGCPHPPKKHPFLCANLLALLSPQANNNHANFNCDSLRFGFSPWLPKYGGPLPVGSKNHNCPKVFAMGSNESSC